MASLFNYFFQNNLARFAMPNESFGNFQVAYTVEGTEIQKNKLLLKPVLLYGCSQMSGCKESRPKTNGTCIGTESVSISVIAKVKACCL